MTGVVETILLLGEILAAAAGTDDDPDAAKLIARHFAGLKTGVFHRLRDARHGEGDRARDVRAVFDVDVELFIKLGRNFAGNLHDVIRRVEAGNAPHAAAPASGGFPEAFAADPVGADRPDASNNDTTHICFCLWPKRQYRLILWTPAGRYRRSRASARPRTRRRRRS